MNKDKNEVRDLLREAGVDKTELDCAVDKAFDLANIIFDKWLAHQRKKYGEGKV